MHRACGCSSIAASNHGIVDRAGLLVLTLRLHHFRENGFLARQSRFWSCGKIKLSKEWSYRRYALLPLCLLHLLYLVLLFLLTPSTTPSPVPPTDSVPLLLLLLLLLLLQPLPPPLPDHH